MYCQECGTKNTDDAVFCANCGVKLAWGEEYIPRMHQQNIQPQSTQFQNIPFQNGQPQGYPCVTSPKMSKKVETWRIVFGIELIAIVLLLVFAYKNASAYFGARSVAERYFLAYANGDWNSAYQMLELDENDFINENNYEKAAKQDQLPKITSYAVGKIQAFSGDELGTAVDIRYRSKGESSDSVYTVSLNKQRGKKFLLFDDWKISTDDIISKDIMVQVPKDAKVMLEGQELADSYISKGKEKDGYYDTYVIPELFSGTYGVRVTMDGMEDNNGMFHTYNGTYIVTSLRPSEKTMDQLINIAGEDMQKVYAAAMHGNSFATIADLYTNNKDYAEDIEEAYDSFLESAQRDTGDVANVIHISNISASASSYDGNSGPVVEVRLQFDYSVDFSYEDFWTGEMRPDTYDSSDSVIYDFIYENGEWLPSNLGCHTLYY